MATKKQKRLAGIAKREKEDADRREREQHFLQVARDERRREREKAEEARQQRKIAKSKKLAKQHKEGIKAYNPMRDEVRKALQKSVSTQDAS